MLELMNPVALEVGEARRREIAKETMRAVRASETHPRQATGSALMFLGQRVGGQQGSPVPASPSPKMQPSGDCI